jgi:copper chaperone CopZ
MKQTLAFLTLAATLTVTSFAFAADKKIVKKTVKTETQTVTTTTPDHQTATLTIEGMHCGGCKKMVTKAVCEDAALAPNFQSCEITNLDTKAQIGTLVINYKKDATVDVDSLEKAIKTAGDYKLTKKEISAKVTK